MPFGLMFENECRNCSGFLAKDGMLAERAVGNCLPNGIHAQGNEETSEPLSEFAHKTDKSIVVDNVNFNDPQALEYTLQDVSLTIPMGKMTAVVDTDLSQRGIAYRHLYVFFGTQDKPDCRVIGFLPHLVLKIAYIHM